MSTYRRSVALMAALTLGAVACSDSTGPEEGALNVSGSWSGTSLLPNGRSTQLSLIQNGTSISGTAKVSGAFPAAGLAINGEFQSSNRRVTWVALHDCEIWAVVLTVNSAGTEMSGAVQIDRSACVPAQSSGSGTMTVVRGES